MRERESKSLRGIVKFFFSFLFLTLSFFLFSFSVSATSYYVAGDTGLDTNDGSISTPWKTIQKAAGTALAPGDVVNVKGGLTYAETVTPSTSGTLVGGYITYQSWNGTGQPTIDGTGKNFGIEINNKSYLIISGFVIKNQTFAGVYSALSNPSNIVIKNNIFSNVAYMFGGINVSLGTGSVNIKIINNTFYKSGGIAFQYSGSGTRSVEIKNNIIIGNNSGDNGIGISDANIIADSDYNIVWNNTTNYVGVVAGGHDASVDPLFFDSSIGNFKLQKSSPAIGAGTDLSGSGVTSDILGVARPQGSGYDIGAYEYYDVPVTLSTTPTTPSTNTTPTIIGNSSTISGATISSVTYSVDSGSWSSTGVTGTDSFTIVVPALADGSHTVRVRATDSYGNVSDSTLYGSTTFTVDTTAPTSNSVSINSGATYSTSIGVMLTLASTGATQMMVSENSGFSGASWETYSTSKSFTLSTGDGTKTVYVKFKDSVDNTSSSVSDTIILDTANPTLGSFVSPRDYTKDDNKPTLTFKKAIDSTSNISSYSVSLDSGKNKNYSTSGIPATGDTTKSSYIWKDDSSVKVEYFNESDSDSANDEIRVYFKGLNDSELTEGKHSWKVTVTDIAGNETSSTQEFYFDKTSSNISELAIANLSTVKAGQNYSISIFKRTPSFSGIATDRYSGSTKENIDGSKDTFDKVSSSPDKLTLTLKKLKDKNKNIYEDYLSKEYSLTDIKDDKNNDKSQRFYITVPNPLKDGYYQVTLSLKDKAGNTNNYPTFYLSMGNSSIFSSVTSFVSDLFGNGSPSISPSPTIQANSLKVNKQQSFPKLLNIFSWVVNLFKNIFHK